MTQRDVLIDQLVAEARRSSGVPLQEKSVITRTIEVAGGAYAPGHLGELTQVVDFTLVDAVLEETGTRERRLRLLPSRVVVYFILALALFEDCSYRGCGASWWPGWKDWPWCGLRFLHCPGPGGG
jgi:hypothetical protein